MEKYYSIKPHIESVVKHFMEIEAVKNLGDFLEQEMYERHMSARAFAEFLEVSHATINNLIRYGRQETGYPSVEFLIRLATATQTDIGYLITLVAPPELMRSELDPDVINMSQRILKLPPPYRKIIEQIIATGLEEIAASNDQIKAEKNK